MEHLVNQITVTGINAADNWTFVTEYTAGYHSSPYTAIIESAGYSMNGGRLTLKGIPNTEGVSFYARLYAKAGEKMKVILKKGETETWVKEFSFASQLAWAGKAYKFAGPVTSGTDGWTKTE